MPNPQATISVDQSRVVGRIVKNVNKHSAIRENIMKNHKPIDELIVGPNEAKPKFVALDLAFSRIQVKLS